jgi:bacteriochlorophyll 4-vinyl reductase
MRESTASRLLVASLHAAIDEILPTRLGFYEEWLTADGIREGTIGVAPLQAVISFLRREGAAYEAVMACAGTRAATWTVAGLPSIRRGLLARAPVWLRRRMLLGVARDLVRKSASSSRAVTSVRKGSARLDLRASVFCDVRQPVGHPLCIYYRSAFAGLMAAFAVPTRVRVVTCRGIGDPSCVFELSPETAADVPDADLEAA